MTALKNNPNARVYLKELDVYTFTNIAKRTYSMCYDAYGIKANTATQTPMTSPNKRWLVECTGTAHHYYIKNKNGKYINDISVGTSCSGTSSETAVVFKANYLDTGMLYFTTQDGEIYLTLDIDSGNIVAGRELTDASTWAVRLAEQNNTAIDEVLDEATEECFYDLTGRKVDYPSKGVYIVNGKKFLVK